MVGDALITTYAKLPAGLRRTPTWDQGNEMFHHERLQQATGVKIYFADPHSPRNRGSNENTIGLLRQYLSKGGRLLLRGHILRAAVITAPSPPSNARRVGAGHTVRSTVLNYGPSWAASGLAVVSSVLPDQVVLNGLPRWIWMP